MGSAIGDHFSRIASTFRLGNPKKFARSDIFFYAAMLTAQCPALCKQIKL